MEIQIAGMAIRHAGYQCESQCGRGIIIGHEVINGTVIGPVIAGESLELLPLARVTGDVEYHQIEMQQGAVIQGGASESAKTIELKLASSK